jgi:hypothetical protein
MVFAPLHPPIGGGLQEIWLPLALGVGGLNLEVLG